MEMVIWFGFYFCIVIVDIIFKNVILFVYILVFNMENENFGIIFFLKVFRKIIDYL